MIEFIIHNNLFIDFTIHQPNESLFKFLSNQINNYLDSWFKWTIFELIMFWFKQIQFFLDNFFLRKHLIIFNIQYLNYLIFNTQASFNTWVFLFLNSINILILLPLKIFLFDSIMNLIRSIFQSYRWNHSFDIIYSVNKNKIFSFVWELSLSIKLFSSSVI
jgi:hypothetical protein